MMTAMSDEQKTRANWILDKALMGVAAVLLLQSYNNVTSAIKEFGGRIGELEHRTRMIEYRLDHHKAFHNE